ncbi:MAG TPA: 3-phosphoshikimate 1-carboxyvinyltransferase [Balneolaceae bacterium]|nr:3-phosphoshikimate 1-carboxyvinyltransferase [Balneolaceae bacterium]
MTESIHPAAKLRGEITMPADKSISHRAALFASISDESSVIENYSRAADPASTLSCLRSLGVKISKEGDRVEIEGVGRDGFLRPETPLDCGNSGTTMRLLGGIIAGAGVRCTLTGDESLSSRTMKRITDPLTKMGAAVSARENLYAPLEFSGHIKGGIHAIRFPLPIASAQLKSSVLLAGLFGDDETEVVEHIQSRDHTERLLGLRREPYGDGKIIRSSRSDVIPAQNYRVPGDFSAAAFWLVAGSVHKNASIRIPGTGINPTRIAVLEVLKKMGANITESNPSFEGEEPTADLHVESASLTGIELDPALIPNCIDELPVLMVAMCFAEGISKIKGAEELRHKETDRLAAMTDVLKKAGASIESLPDGMIINGNPSFEPNPSVYESFHDHRIAMAAAVLSLAGKKVSGVKDSECTAISYPEFWDHLKKLTITSL